MPLTTAGSLYYSEHAMGRRNINYSQRVGYLS
jgi:hypothetical protein